MVWPHHRYARVLLIAYGVLFVALAFSPYDRFTWALENAPALIAVASLVVTANRFPLSRISYTLIFIFTALHTIGAHHTYSLVPYNEWTQWLLGSRLNDWFGWQRNHFDRLIHFLYGLLIAYPIREYFLRVADVRGFWGYCLPLDVTMSTSMGYELVEWVIALIFGSDGTNAYLGTQGDEWDAQKDMALATAGATIAMLVTAMVNWRLRRDFAREIADSLRVKHVQPLGEDEIIAMTRKRP